MLATMIHLLLNKQIFKLWHCLSQTTRLWQATV